MSRRRVLIAGADTRTATDLEARLTTLGYDIAGAVPAAEAAITDSADDLPDLVIVDVPAGAAGARAALLARLRLQQIPVVLLISPTDEPGLLDPARGHPVCYVVKPFETRELRVNLELSLCRRDAEVAVRDMEDRFFATSIDLLCFLDFDGYFKRVNPAWEHTLGFTRQELMSRPFIEFVHPDDRERTLQQNARVRSGGKALSFENRYVCKDGSYRWLRWNAAPDATERVIYSLARDITESKRIEEERERLVNELRAALAEVNKLRSILPICSYCRKIRDDENYWHTVESYLARNTSTQFSHGICPSCLALVDDIEV